MRRRQSREIALQLLFQSEFAPQISCKEFIQIFEHHFDHPTVEFAEELIDTVKKHQTEIDATIESASQRWKINRMPTVDRNILRLAVAEMKYLKIDEKVTINEAIELAKKYGTTDSPSFVNGVLDQVYKRN